MDVSSKRSHSESDDDGDQERKLPRLVPYDSTDDEDDDQQGDPKNQRYITQPDGQAGEGENGTIPGFSYSAAPIIIDLTGYSSQEEVGPHDIQEGGAVLTRSSTRQRMDGLTDPRLDQERSAYTPAFSDQPFSSVHGVTKAEPASTEPRVMEANVVPDVNDEINAAIPGPSGLNREIEAETQSQSQSQSQSEDSQEFQENSQRSRKRRPRKFLFKYDQTPPKIFKKESAKSFKASPISPSANYQEECNTFHDQLTSFLKRERRAHYPRGAKVHVGMKVKYQVIKEGKLVDEPEFIYNSKSVPILRGSDIHTEMGPAMAHLNEQIADQQERGSGFVFNAISYFHVTMARYTPLPGGNFIPTPVWLAKKRATLNVNTKDNRCIIDCINAQLHPTIANANRPGSYARYRPNIKTEGVNFPAGTRDIDRLEKLNPHLSINVFAYQLTEKKGKRQCAKFYPYRISKNRGPEKTIVNLLLLEDEEGQKEQKEVGEEEEDEEEEVGSSKRHYILIKDLARLTAAANSKNCRRSYVCCYCLQHFTHQRLLNAHEPLCQEHKAQSTQFPMKGKKDRLAFAAPEKQQPAKYFAVFDAETKEVLNNGPEQPPEYLLAPDEVRKYPWIKFPSEVKHAETCRKCKTLKPCPKIRRSTKKRCTLEPFSFALKVISTDGPEHDLPLRMYQGPNCAQVFLRWLKEDMTTVHQILNRNAPIQMTDEDWQRHNTSTHCNICKQAYTEDNPKVRDHDHTVVDGPNYRQPACNRCNLAWKAGPVSIFAHNMTAFDGHLIMTAVAEEEKEIKCVENVIAKNKEKFVSFDMRFRCDPCIAKGLNARNDDGKENEDGGVKTPQQGSAQHDDCTCHQIQKLVFKDSFQFLIASLEKLTTNLKSRGRTEDCSNCQYTEEETRVYCSSCTDKDEMKDVFKRTYAYVADKFGKQHFPLLTSKQIYPYSYMNDWEKLKETQLPPIEAFYNSLRKEALSPEQYAHGQRVWNELGFSTMEEFCGTYLALDVLLLADVFEDFRRLSLREYELAPENFFTLPGLSLSAALKLTGANLQLITDPNLYLWFESMIRGGICFVAHRESRSNLEHMSSYDPDKKRVLTSYFDANNLYGYAMSQYLPYDNLRFCDEHELAYLRREFHENAGKNLGLTNDVGYALEVTLRFPEDKKEFFAKYPPLSEKRVVQREEYSAITHQLMDSYQLKTPPTTKLITDLNEKSHYKIHYAMLKEVLDLGMELVEIHEAVRFDQKPWLKEYIHHNHEKRKLATSASEKDFWKLLNNSCFGKLSEDVRKRQNIHVVRCARWFERWVSRINYVDCTILSTHTALVRSTKVDVLLNKPIYLGACVLDLSKLKMVQAWYRDLKPQLDREGSQLKLCMTDTDSFIFSVEYDDVDHRCPYKDLADLAPTLDTSNYGPENPLFTRNPEQKTTLLKYQRDNKSELGLLKDECGNQTLEHVICLRPKSYACRLDNREEHKKLKGIGKAVTKNEISFDDYEKTLQTHLPQRHRMNCFRSIDHKLYMLSVEKTSLSLFDDKRYWINHYDSVPYGHPLCK